MTPSRVRPGQSSAQQLWQPGMAQAACCRTGTAWLRQLKPKLALVARLWPPGGAGTWPLHSQEPTINRIDVGMQWHSSKLSDNACHRQSLRDRPPHRAWELAGTPGRRHLTGQRQPAAAAYWDWGCSLYIRSAQLPEETLQGAAPTGRDPVLQTSVNIEHLHEVQIALQLLSGTDQAGRDCCAHRWSAGAAAAASVPAESCSAGWAGQVQGVPPQPWPAQHSHMLSAMQY